MTNSFLIRRGDEYRLSHRSILEYLVALRLNKEIEADHPDVFGTFLIGYAVHNFLKKFEPNIETVFRWIQLTKGGGHPENPWLGTNAANLLNRVSPDYFAGKDLSDTTLIGVDFRDADLRNTILENARLNDADLVSARFFKKDIGSSKTDNAEVSFFVLKTGQIRKQDPEEFFDDVMDIFHHKLELVIWEQSSFRDDLFWEISFHVKDIQHFEFCREKLATMLSTKVAIYFDECEELAREQDSAKPKNKPKASRKPSS